MIGSAHNVFTYVQLINADMKVFFVTSSFCVDVFWLWYLGCVCKTPGKVNGCVRTPKAERVKLSE